MTGQTAPVRVVLFDDTPRHNRWFAKELTEAGITVVGAAETPQEIHGLIKNTPFDVAILDVHVGASREDLTGLSIGLWLRKHRPDVGVLMFTSFDSEFAALRLLSVDPPHGVGYLVKNRVHHTRDIVHAIAAVKDRRNVFDHQIEAALLPQRGQNHPGEALTPIEIRTLRHMVEGHTNEAIAAIFGVSVKAIDTRCTAIFRKLGIADLNAPDKINRRVTAVVHYIKNLEKFRYVWDIPPIDWPPP